MLLCWQAKLRLRQGPRNAVVVIAVVAVVVISSIS